MKNVTIALDDETHRLARIRAAELGTSLSAMGKAYLQGKWQPGSAWNNDPNARASFGLHRGSRPLIYMRELY